MGTHRSSFSTEQQIKGTLQKSHYDRDWQQLHHKLDQAEKTSCFVLDNQGTHRTFSRERDHLKDHYSDGSHQHWGAQLKSPRNRTSYVTHDRSYVYFLCYDRLMRFYCSKHYDYGFDRPSYTPTAQEFLVRHSVTSPKVFAGKSPAWISPAARGSCLLLFVISLIAALAQT